MAKKSEAAEQIHLKARSHHLDFDKTRILDRDHLWLQRSIREAIYIGAQKPKLVHHSSCWGSNHQLACW